MEQSTLDATARMAEIRSVEAIVDRLLKTLPGEPSREYLTLIAQALGENTTDNVATFQKFQGEAKAQRKRARDRSSTDQ